LGQLRAVCKSVSAHEHGGYALTRIGELLAFWVPIRAV